MDKSTIVMTIGIALVVIAGTFFFGGTAFNNADAEHNSAFRHQLDLREEKMLDRTAELDAREERVVWLEHMDSWFMEFETYVDGISTYTVLTPEGEEFVTEFQELVLEGKNFRAMFDDDYRKLLEENDKLRQQLRASQGNSSSESGATPSDCSATGENVETVTLPEGDEWSNWIGPDTGEVRYEFCGALNGAEVYSSDGNYYNPSEVLVLEGPITLSGQAGKTVTVYWTPQ